MNILKSIKWRILLLQAIIVALVLTVGAFIKYSSHKQKAEAARQASIKRSLNVAFLHVLPMEKGRKSKLPMSKRTKRIMQQFRNEPTRASVHQNLPFYVIWNRNKQIVAKSILAPEWVTYPKLHHVRNTPEKSYIITSEQNDYLLQTDFDNDGYAATVGYSNLRFDKLNRVYALKITAICLAIFVAFLLINYWIISREHRPISTISRAAKRIENEGKYSSIDLGDTSIELHSLATSLNQGYQKLDSQINTQKQFTNDVAHELRTPIAVVKMANKRIAKHSEPSLKEVIDLQQANITQMEQMVEKMLQLSQLQGASAPLEFHSFSVREKITQVVSSLRLLDISSQKEIIVDCQQDLQLHSNSTAFIQILSNLLENALKYASSKVTLTVAQVDLAYHISITDDGQGIAEEFLPHLFERFFRVDKSRSLNDGGVGLGLAIVEELIRQLDGEILVRSTIGKGTTFTVIHPAEKASKG